MTRGIVVAVALLAAAWVGTGCAKKTVRPEERQRQLSEYLPLSVGNSWTYDRVFLGEEGEQTVQIVREEDGFYVDDRGNALAVDAHGIRDPKRYLLRYPLESGREWTTIVSVSSMERYKILDVGFRCEVPAGTFTDCVRVEGRSRIDAEQWMVNQITFAPGVGMVRFEFFLDTANKRIPQGQMVLKRFEVAQAQAEAR